MMVWQQRGARVPPSGQHTGPGTKRVPCRVRRIEEMAERIACTQSEIRGMLKWVDKAPGWREGSGHRDCMT